MPWSTTLGRDSFHFVVKVRDYTFWRRSDVSACLSQALRFMTGDREYRFSFQPGHSTERTSLFDDEQFRMENSQDPNVALFSGGIDSLAGVLDHLESTSDAGLPCQSPVTTRDGEDSTTASWRTQGPLPRESLPLQVRVPPQGHPRSRGNSAVQGISVHKHRFRHRSSVRPRRFQRV